MVEELVWFASRAHGDLGSNSLDLIWRTSYLLFFRHYSGYIQTQFVVKNVCHRSKLVSTGVRNKMQQSNTIMGGARTAIFLDAAVSIMFSMNLTTRCGTMRTIYLPCSIMG